MWKRHGIFGIGIRRANKEISDFLSVSRRMMKKVRKELENSGFNYKATAQKTAHD